MNRTVLLFHSKLSFHTIGNLFLYTIFLLSSNSGITSSANNFPPGWCMWKPSERTAKNKTKTNYTTSKTGISVKMSPRATKHGGTQNSRN